MTNSTDNTAALISALEGGPSLIIPMLRDMPPEKLKQRPAPKKWSAHEHACHLGLVHKLFFDRLERMLREDGAKVVPYNPDDEPEDMLLTMDLEATLAKYAKERTEILAKIRPLTPAQWQRTARHPDYSRYTVYIMFRHLQLHDMLHAYRIEELAYKPNW
jgi:hypothetical protein